VDVFSAASGEGAVQFDNWIRSSTPSPLISRRIGRTRKGTSAGTL